MPKLAPIVFASADPLAREVYQLIADFQRAARVAVTALGREAGHSTDPLGAWRSGRTPRSGRLKEPNGRYAFHGAGCRFEISGRTIEVQFGPGGRHDGFDGWRLTRYTESAFEWHEFSHARIERGLKQLASTGTIFKPAWEPSPDLYYLLAHEGGARVRAGGDSKRRRKTA